MSATWFLLSPLPAKELLAVEQECLRAVEEYLAEHPDCDDSWGDLGAGPLPSVEQVREAYALYRLPLPAAILERLAGCRSALAVDHPGDLDTDRLQVSVLCFLLERIGDGFVLFNDYPLVRSDAALLDLRKRHGAAGFGDFAAGPARPRPVRRRKERPGEVRAVRILQSLQSAMENPEIGLDLKRALEGVSALATRYARLLLEEGAQDDAQAARKLDVPRDHLAAAARDLETALSEVSA